MRRPKKDLVLGIDPGLKGALTLLRMGDEIFIESVIDMPILITKVCNKTERVIDGTSLRSFLDHYAHRINFCVIEKVHAMPNQGVVSTFRFGEGYGFVKGMLRAFEITTLFVPPSVWKMQMGVTAVKKTSINKIKQLIHSKKIIGDENIFDVKDGRAESALLALLGVEIKAVKEVKNNKGEKCITQTQNTI